MLQKKIDAPFQKGLKNSGFRRCTVTYKENNVYNICLKRKQNRIDAMPLFGISTSGLAGWVRTCETENPKVPGEARDPEVRR